MSSNRRSRSASVRVSMPQPAAHAPTSWRKRARGVANAVAAAAPLVGAPAAAAGRIAAQLLRGSSTSSGRSTSSRSTYRYSGRSSRSSGSANDQAIAYAPTAISATQRFMTKARTMRSVTNSEYIGNIAGSVAFVFTQYHVNPGLATVFPWLSTIATNYQTYHFRRLRFRYITRAATTATGSILMAPEYNCMDPAQQTESTLSNSDGSVEDSPWREITCVFDPKAMHGSAQRKQIRTVNVSGDLNLYDAAILNVGVVGQADGSNVGKLWVDYAVDLFTPQSTVLGTYPMATSMYLKTAAQTFTTGVAATVTFDNAVAGYDPLNVGNPAAGTFTPAAGVYRIMFQTTCVDTTGETFTIALTYQKNGAGALSRTNQYSATVSPKPPLNQDYIMSFNGVDTFTIVATLTGAAGTLTMAATNTTLIFTRA